ncbi:hypothetical protein F5Y16DRAFT_371574 [Xylariaceae sp. FL0255]|nr:hypothetical protein F5Y16DRAFT_371574 [Xylariaceae sp. FL0255]
MQNAGGTYNAPLATEQHRPASDPEPNKGPHTRVGIADARAMPWRSFEFDIPEHLPSSPICPANARHPMGGAGVCVYHGRRSSNALARRNTDNRHSEGGSCGSVQGEDGESYGGAGV